jgi:hypothetical protein
MTARQNTESDNEPKQSVGVVAYFRMSMLPESIFAARTSAVGPVHLVGNSSNKSSIICGSLMPESRLQPS